MPFPTCGIPGIPDLMHHKYVVRDGALGLDRLDELDDGLVDASGERGAHGERVARARRRVRAELRGALEGPGRGRQRAHEEPRRLEIAGRDTRAWFTPGHGPELSHRIAQAIASARRRVRIASPVITAGPVLGTLAEVSAERRVDLRGVVDRTQMEQVVYQWRTNGHSAWKIPILASVLVNADFKGKRSTQYSPETPHDFMHAKVTVADDTVFAARSTCRARVR